MEPDVLALISTVKETSPEVWAILHREVMVTAIRRGTVMAAMFAVALATTLYGRQQRDVAIKSADKETAALAILSFLIGFICIIFGIGAFLDVVGYVINPDYAAINLLADMTLCR